MDEKLSESHKCDHNEMFIGPPAHCANCGYVYGTETEEYQDALDQDGDLIPQLVTRPDV